LKIEKKRIHKKDNKIIKKKKKKKNKNIEKKVSFCLFRLEVLILLTLG